MFYKVLQIAIGALFALTIGASVLIHIGNADTTKETQQPTTNTAAPKFNF